MNGWASYRLQDFVPFTEEIYFRLLERMGETFWPLHLLTLFLGGAAVVLVLKNRARLALALLAPVWGWVGMTFFMQRYSELNWAGSYVGYAFWVQAGLLLVLSLVGRGLGKTPYRHTPPFVAGMAIVLFGLVFQPFIAPLSGSSWYQAEVFGIHPDPTAVTVLGLVLIGLRGVPMWLAAPIPLLWLVVSALTLVVLDSLSAVALLVVLAVGLTGLVWKTATE